MSKLIMSNGDIPPSRSGRIYKIHLLKQDNELMIKKFAHPRKLTDYGHYLSKEDVIRLANNNGMSSEEFEAWFDLKEGETKEAYIICCSDKIDYEMRELIEINPPCGNPCKNLTTACEKCKDSYYEWAIKNE